MSGQDPAFAVRALRHLTSEPVFAARLHGSRRIDAIAQARRCPFTLAYAARYPLEQLRWHDWLFDRCAVTEREREHILATSQGLRLRVGFT